MATEVQGFLGKSMRIPEDRVYLPAEHLWVREVAEGLWDVGVTEAGVLLWGGIRQVELLVDPGESVEAGQTVCVLLTAKVKYLSSPLAGDVLPVDLDADPNRDPYGAPLFRVRAGDAAAPRLANARSYAQCLKESEGMRNPSGATGPGSSICKALYWGIRQQKLQG